MALERFTRLDPARQALILHAAANELASHGPAASMNRILKATGISKGQFYYYFADRDDLFTTVVEHEVHRFLEGLTDPRLLMDGPQTFWPCIQATTLQLMAKLDASPRSAAFIRLIYGEPSLGVDTLRAQFDGWAAEMLTVGQEMGAVRSDLPQDLLVAALSGLAVALDRWFAMQWDKRPADELVALSQASFSMVEAALAP